MIIYIDGIHVVHEKFASVYLTKEKLNVKIELFEETYGKIKNSNG